MNENLALDKHRDNYIDVFEYIVNCQEKKISRFIFRMINDADATQDLTQEVLINIYKNLYKYNPEYPIEPWIFKIAHNVTINYIRKNKKRISEIPLHEICQRETSVEDIIEDIEIRELILKEISFLKPECKEIFLLRVMEDLSFEQISEILNKSVTSIKLKYYRSRRVIIEKIGEYIKEGEI